MDYVVGPLKRIFRRPAFVVSLVMMGVCAATLQVGARALQVHFRKESVSLQKPFDQLDETKLLPYKVVHRYQIPAEIEEELGTKDYIQWVLEDTSVEEKDPRRFLMLFITYYTGNPDRVPHVPDWCYVGSGGEVKGSENVTITVPNNRSSSDAFRMRMLKIQVPRRGFGAGFDMKTVGYFFSVNGDYLCTRTEVRVRQGSLRDKYAYFSKVELNLVDPKDLSYDEIIAALEKLAQKLVPILAWDHWPDWAALTAGPQGASE